MTVPDSRHDTILCDVIESFPCLWKMLKDSNTPNILSILFEHSTNELTPIWLLSNSFQRHVCATEHTDMSLVIKVSFEILI